MEDRLRRTWDEIEKAAEGAPSVVQPVVRPSALRQLLRATRSIGWDIDWLDVDLTASAPMLRMRLTRFDGRFLIVDVDNIGRCVVERYQRRETLGLDPMKRGRRPLERLIDDEFLGRTRFSGPRAMLRHVTEYLCDNARHPIPLSDMRTAWAGIMDAPVVLLSN